MSQDYRVQEHEYLSSLKCKNNYSYCSWILSIAMVKLGSAIFRSDASHIKTVCI